MSLAICGLQHRSPPRAVGLGRSKGELVAALRRRNAGGDSPRKTPDAYFTLLQPEPNHLEVKVASVVMLCPPPVEVR